MNNSARVIRRPRWEWSPTARLVVAIIAAAGLALPAATFGNSQSTNTQKALAYSRCMRSHGVPTFPDPNSSGAVPKVSAQQLGVSSTVLQAAQNHCRSLLPNGGSGPSQTQVQQIMNGMLKFAQCMRSHGVANWPDPVVDAGGNPEFYLDGQGQSELAADQKQDPRLRALDTLRSHIAGEPDRVSGRQSWRRVWLWCMLVHAGR